MKLLSAALTALVVTGFAAAASAACMGHVQASDQTAQAPIVPPQGATGS